MLTLIYLDDTPYMCLIMSQLVHHEDNWEGSGEQKVEKCLTEGVQLLKLMEKLNVLLEIYASFTSLFLYSLLHLSFVLLT